jgi:hypothetical protein
MVMEKLKRHKSPNADQIPAELIKTGGRIFLSESQKLHYVFLFGIRRKYLKSGKS